MIMLWLTDTKDDGVFVLGKDKAQIKHGWRGKKRGYTGSM